MSFLETITFVDVLCHHARTSWLYEIEQTAKYGYNLHDFLSDILLASNLCFQILKNSSPQVTDGLKQFCDLYLWVKLKHFFFSCLVPPGIGDIWVLNSLTKVQKRLSPDIHKNLRVYWGAQTHTDEETNNSPQMHAKNAPKTNEERSCKNISSATKTKRGICRG